VKLVYEKELLQEITTWVLVDDRIYLIFDTARD
jgi:hypothetical protein